MNSASRSRLVGLTLGLVLLLAVVLLAVVLPRLDGASAEDGAAASTSSTEAVLPDSLPGLVSVESASPDQAADLRTRLDSAEQRLEAIYDVPVTIGLYGGDAAASGKSGGGQPPASDSSLVVTALPAPQGLFLPTGPAPEPELVGLTRNPNDLVEVGDAVCNLSYGEPVPQGQPVDESAPPAGVQCQLASGGVSFQGDGTGLSADDVVAALDALAAGQG